MPKPEDPPSQPFRFLDLPSELRNHIYGFCNEAGTVVAGCSPNAPPATTGQFHNLCLVNSQVQEEFSPIYHTVQHVQLSMREVELYVRTFFLQTETICGRLFLFISPTHHPLKDDIDVLPLLRACAKNPDLDVTVRSDFVCITTVCLQALVVGLGNNPATKLARWLPDKVKFAKLKMKRRELDSLEIGLEEGCKHGFEMTYVLNQWGRSSTRYWCNQLGIYGNWDNVVIRFLT
ncbi:hypothetical protein P280DRAFT_37477 [Massarina eburnea CBS 473.64]|uniref:F-box domain-containing protein n=1 Tax=Massarina eburnea CBS 473.64 TaxID=1395130 RepID=A0A6A6RFU3_9PLEO|nr:hypothetical protein P280DRAFT_37477 [Massarina eburnea CBS 473.64]